MTHEQSLTALAVAGSAFGGLPTTVIPAAPGTTATLIMCEIGDERPQRRDLQVTHPAVIGWRFTSDCTGAEPVFAFDPFTRPDRRIPEVFVRDDEEAGSPFRGQRDETAATLAEAKALVFRRACQTWDEHQQLRAYLGSLAARRLAAVSAVAA